MKRGLATLFLIIMAISSISASMGLSNSEVNQLSCATFQTGKSTFIGKEIPKEIPYKNEIFNIYIGEEVFGYLEIENSGIADFGCTQREDMTYSIYIEDYSTLGDFVEVEEPIKVLKEKLKTDEIRVEGASLGKKIKWGFTRFGLNFMKVFVKN